MCKVIIDRNLHDETWLKNYSCAPLLIEDATGNYVHPKEGMYAAWDTKTNSMIEIDPEKAGGPDDGTSGPESTLALDGSFEVDGIACHPSLCGPQGGNRQIRPCNGQRNNRSFPRYYRAATIDYGSAKTAGIRMTQGIQRCNYSFLPFRAIATLAAITGNIGKPGGGAGHIYSQGAGNALKNVESDAPAPNFTNWENTGGESQGPAYLAAVQVGGLSHKTSEFYDKAIQGGVDFMWIATSNFLNMSPDAHKIIDEVFPAIDFIVCADPFWTWTAKYADIVLPASTNWENWDINARAPWIRLNHPAIERMGESKSDCEMMTALAPLIGVEDHWQNSDEGWVKEFMDTKHPGWKSFDWDAFVEDGCFGRDDGIYEPCYTWGNKVFGTDSKRFEFYTESLVPFGLQVPTYREPHEDPNGELGEKYPLVFLQYHDRITIHAQHLLAPALKIVSSEPLLQMHPEDAKARNISHGDAVRVFNDRGECTVHVVLTEGIVPGTVALPHGWTPDYFINGEYQYLTHYKKNEAEEFFSQSNAALYDVLVEVQKA